MKHINPKFKSRKSNVQKNKYIKCLLLKKKWHNRPCELDVTTGTIILI